MHLRRARLKHMSRPPTISQIHLEDPLALVGACWCLLGASWAPLGGLLGPSGDLLGPCECLLRDSSSKLAPPVSLVPDFSLVSPP